MTGFRNLMTGAAGAAGGGYQVDNSAVFNDDDSGYLTRTPSSAGNQQKWTLSFWFKFGSVTGRQMFYAQDEAYISINENSSTSALINIYLTGVSPVWYWETTAMFRDPHGWYHVVVAFDSTNGTADNRLRLYINGDEITSFTKHSTGNQDAAPDIGGTSDMIIGKHPTNSAQYYDGYFSEYVYVNGSQLAPTSFGETDDNGVWRPINVSGLTFGTNGFYLNFAASGADLGDDASGNSNDFTNNNSATQTSDSPTNNHCVMSPLWAASSQTLSEGNLKVVGSTSNEGVGGTHTLFNNAYWEIKNTANGAGSGQRFGVASANKGISHPSSGHGGGTTGNHTYHVWDQNNTIYQSDNGAAASAGTHSAWSSFTTGDVISFHVDGTNLKVRKNNDSFDTIISSFTATDWMPFIETYNGTVELRFQEDDWTQTLPTGAKAINTTNQFAANAPAIKDGSAHHQTSIWQGDITARKITQSGFNSTFQPDWIWGKNRDNSGYSYRYFDSVRGATKVLQTGGSSYTDPEATDSNGVTDFEADGFDIGNGVHLNGDGESIVAWQWAAGGEPTTDNVAGAGATPTAGSVKIDGSNLGSSLGGTIPVTRLSANRTSGFSIGTYTGSGSNGTIATGLTTKPDMLIIKKRGDDGGNNWVTYHSGLANQGTGYVDLGTNAAEGTLANMFNSVAPGSSDATLFNVGTNTSTNDTGGSDTYVFYCFHSVPGYSKFGTYTGNGGSGDGPFVNLGFSPSWILYRNISASAGWRVFDSARDTSNVVEQSLTPNTTNAEKGDQSNVQGDFLSNGWKVRNPSNTGDGGNVNNNVYIYAAFAEHPFAGTTPATAR